jgi:hypothetical protein
MIEWELLVKKAKQYLKEKETEESFTITMMLETVKEFVKKNS